MRYRTPIVHYVWSPVKSLTIVCLLSLALVLVARDMTDATKRFAPVSRQDINKIIARNHRDVKLVQSIIQVESGWRQKAVSSAGAVGLMQVRPASARMVGLNYSHKDLLCPEKNIKAGTRILRHYQRMTRGNLERALDLYSGGARGYYRKVMNLKQFQRSAA